MLRDYQIDIIERLREAWQTHRGVMVQMPTGTGKTHVLADVVREERGVKGGESNSNGTCVWIIAHRRELVAQIEDTLGRYGIKTEVGREDKGKGRIRVMSIQWLARHWEDVKHKPELIVIDEAHHAQARTYRMLWDRCPQARFLGLTATPCRMNRSGFTELFDTLICSWSVAEFIERGVLSAFDYVSIRQGSEEQRIIDSLERRGADGDYQIKEMNDRLNRRQSISRLYESIERFAKDRKGIVYAISIEHARSIAAYYNKKGVNAVAIDSRTPAAERKRMVSDFKTGSIQVLVNVDVFSEGFDCPDVEFVQMARPTLSLAKYLQQVGRGLRKVDGKEACVLIDNAGLYRVFGLPTVAWNWQTMFRGEQVGKGLRASARSTDSQISAMPVESTDKDCGLEVIVSHGNLLSVLAEQKVTLSANPQGKAPGLRAWQDAESGFWGLRRGRTKTTGAVFKDVLDIRYDMAAVRFGDNNCALVNADGSVIWQRGRYRAMKFLRNYMMHVTASDGRAYYADLHSLRLYAEHPSVERYGAVELLRIGRKYYSRTRAVYATGNGIERACICRRRFYVTILNYDNAAPYDHQYTYVCLFDGDHESYYHVCRWLADGSIVVRDPSGRCYHAEEGKAKTYIGTAGTEPCFDAIERLVERVGEYGIAERDRKRLSILEMPTDALPFRAGTKWGLRIGQHIVVPPIYRSVRPPVGIYCAVEKNYSQWGIIAVDGTVMVEPKYSDVAIDADGTAMLTFVTGKQMCVKL